MSHLEAVLVTLVLGALFGAYAWWVWGYRAGGED